MKVAWNKSHLKTMATGLKKKSDQIIFTHIFFKKTGCFNSIMQYIVSSAWNIKPHVLINFQTPVIHCIAFWGKICILINNNLQHRS